jgi:hypothetical protein
LGVLPAGTLANAVPDRIQFWLNIDFASPFENPSGGNFRKARSARQKMPDWEIFADPARQILPLFIKAAGMKAAQMLGKTWFMPGHGKMNKYGESVAAAIPQPAGSSP